MLASIQTRVCVCVYRYGIMHSCWQEDPNNRPSFSRLVQELDKMLTSSLKDEVGLGLSLIHI